MESGQHLYDPRNTVALNRPGRKNRERRQILVRQESAPLKLQKFETKVAMASVCRWCGNPAKQSFAICPHCITCQYCGLVPTGSRVCEFCGNRDLDKPKRVRRIVNRHTLAQEPFRKRKRSVRRSGPVNRRRGANLQNGGVL